ncbi:MAG: PilZ domain-containing protein [Methylococcales bacterium]|jgi:hypothetical protein|nr:PilZ domain-containing protein [Methylococcales bacterium]
MERRVNPRCLATLEYVLHIDNVDYHGMTSNISLGGGFLSTSDGKIRDQNPSGKNGTIILKAPAGDLSLQCSVAYAGVHGMGVQFDEVSDEELLKIQEIIEMN